MGFFDDDDDEDEDDHANEVNRAYNNNEEEEEDPLDAYMNSLQNKNHNNSNQNHGEHSSNNNGMSLPQNTIATRLDWENEDHDDNDVETDAHESEQQKSKNWNYPRKVNRDDDEYDDEDLDLQQNQKKNALQSMFVKAHADNNKKTTENAFFANIHLPQAGTAGSSIIKVFWNSRETEHGRQWRKEHQIMLTLFRGHTAAAGIGIGGKRNQTNHLIDPIWKFEELLQATSTSQESDMPEPEATVTALVEHLKAQFPNPTLVQSQTWSVALSGKDALITAATGQGKTFAYVVPMILHCLWNQQQHEPHLEEDVAMGPKGLVLVPTRELALQISKHAQPLLDAISLSSSSSRCYSPLLSCKAIIGGQGKYLLRQELKKSRGKLDIVIATPGRLLDVVSENRKKDGLSLQNISFAVLDEADKMLHMGFEPQVRKIYQSLRQDRQTLMLSATLGRKVEGLAREWLNHSAVRIAVGRTGEASEHVQQHVMVLPDLAAKTAFLIQMLPVFTTIGRTLVFVKTREGCEQLAETIARESQPSIPILTLHGDKHQIDRNAAVRKFTKGEVPVIIATDVAARGLDIPHVQTVVCYDPAKDLDGHTHRIGRTGRLSANKDGNIENQTTGSAYTLLTESDADFAFVLRNAFQREEREIDTQLEALANSSRRAGNGTAMGRENQKNKIGLGFTPFRDETSTSFSSPPPKRQRRWGT